MSDIFATMLVVSGQVRYQRICLTHTICSEPPHMLEVPAHSASANGKPASRIRQKNEEAILKAAEDEFARHGF